MNTITEPAAFAVHVAAPAASIDLTTTQEISNLRAQLELAEQKLAADKAELEQRAKEAQRAVIASIPGLLGVGTIQEALALLKEQVPPANLHNRALPPSTLEQMRLMLENRASSPTVAKALKVGLSTVWAYKARWGLTKNGKPATARRRVRQRGNNHLSASTRLAIWDDLQKPGAKVAVVARKHGTSRQSVYSVLGKGKTKA